jgi:hypothetical protein
MRRAVWGWGLPQAGILANKRLRRKLAPFGYSKCVNTPGLWNHDTRPISFTLVVDDFGVKYVTQADVDHLIASVRSTHTLTEDWSGDLYCGIKLDWDYDKRTVDISMPGSKRNSKNTSMRCRRNRSTVLTHLNQSNLAAKLSGPYRGIQARSLTIKRNSTCNKS